MQTAVRPARLSAHSRKQLSSASCALSRRADPSCHASVVWRQLDHTRAWVAHPRTPRIKGIIHFLGGAFAGAAPQVLYTGFCELLAEAGYTVIATPYAVTFRHDICAKAVRRTFLNSVAELRAAGRTYLVPNKAPQFGVGHSNGALLHLLIGSFEPGATQGNVIISFNNLQVSDAIPIPGFLEGLQPTVQAARRLTDTPPPGTVAGNSSSEVAAELVQADAVSAAAQLLTAATSAVPGFLLPEQQQQLIAGAGPALDQLAAVVNEVGDGLVDFRPTPQESRALIAAGYTCPATLLVRFENDAIDETPEMQQILAQRSRGLAADLSTAETAGAQTEGTVASAAADATVVETAGMLDAGAPQQPRQDAWSSVIAGSMNLKQLLPQLQQLRQQQQHDGQQQQFLQQQQPASLPDVQQLVLPGSHITPCGGPVRGQALLLPTPVDVLLPSSNQPASRSELQNLAANVLLWLAACRTQAASSKAVRAAATAAQQLQQQGTVGMHSNALGQAGTSSYPGAAACPQSADAAAAAR